MPSPCPLPKGEGEKTAQLLAPPHGACGRGCATVPKAVWGRGLSEQASSAALTIGTGAKEPEGPRPGANGFGSFCRNKRTSARGDETPHSESVSSPGEAAKIALTLPSPKRVKRQRQLLGHLMAPSVPTIGGEDCLSEATAALTFGTGAKAPEGPRPGANGFGSFCRNKRISARGETPHPLGARGRNPAKNAL